ncbi:MAG: hypothetical protein LBG47_05415, partial [Prevotellaceae bacterium]|nr:hypothetical protein [Prevotellaceae bacterium]
MIFNNFVMYGNSNLNFQRWYSLDEAIDNRCTITITVETTGTECTYDGSIKVISAYSGRHEALGN